MPPPRRDRLRLAPSESMQLSEASVLVNLVVSKVLNGFLHHVDVIGWRHRWELTP